MLNAKIIDYILRIFSEMYRSKRKKPEESGVSV